MIKQNEYSNMGLDRAIWWKDYHLLCVILLLTHICIRFFFNYTLHCWFILSVWLVRFLQYFPQLRFLHPFPGTDVHLFVPCQPSFLLVPLFRSPLKSAPKPSRFGNTTQVSDTGKMWWTCQFLYLDQCFSRGDSDTICFTIILC